MVAGHVDREFLSFRFCGTRTSPISHIKMAYTRGAEGDQAADLWQPNLDCAASHISGCAPSLWTFYHEADDPVEVV